MINALESKLSDDHKQLCMAKDPRALFRGLLFDPAPLSWPGQRKVLGLCGDDAAKRLLELKELPGVEENRRYDALLVPLSVIEMGTRGGLLASYAEHELCITPYGGRELRGYQAQALTFLTQVTPDREGALLCADPGLGKTTTMLQALHVLGLLDEPGVVCGPAGAEGVWADADGDPAVYFGMDVKPLRGAKTMDPAELIGAKHVWCNYKILPSWAAHLATLHRPRWVLFDESHMLCNPTAARTEAALQLSRAKSIQLRFGATGTPVPNKRLELWAQLALVQPRQWSGTKFDFGMRYCAGKRMAFREGGYFVFDGESHTDELRARLAGTFLRYTKTDVADWLPSVEWNTKAVDIPPEELDAAGYYDVERSIVRTMRQDGSEEGVGTIKIKALTKLISILSSFKVNYAVKEAWDALQTHDHVVVFTHRRESAARIVEQLQDLLEIAGDTGRGELAPHIHGPIDGTVGRLERKRQAQLFAGEDKAVYVCTLGATGVAINDLKQGSCGIFCDLYWTPAVLLQAADRLHREGSPHKRVEFRFIVAHDTVDDAFLAKLNHKSQEAANVAESDTAGLNMCSALSPAEGVDQPSHVNDICSMLEQLERYSAPATEDSSLDFL